MFSNMYFPPAQILQHAKIHVKVVKIDVIFFYVLQRYVVQGNMFSNKIQKYVLQRNLFSVFSLRPDLTICKIFLSFTKICFLQWFFECEIELVMRKHCAFL